MEKIKLIKPSIKYEREILEFKKELIDAGDEFAGCGPLKNCSSVIEWLKIIDMLENIDTRPKDCVTSNTYIAVRIYDDRVIGVIDLRHHIDHPILKVWGGHIGYTVRPSERRKGYAKEMLRLNLLNCKRKGINRVLVTCKSTNVASERVILYNNGKLENEVLVDEDIYKRYIINI